MSEQNPATPDADPADGGDQNQPAEGQPIQLPDDHPLVTALATQKEAIRDLKSQLAAKQDGEKTAEERLKALEDRAVKAERSALIKSVQAKHGISDEDASLFLTGSSAEDLEKQAARLAARSDELKRNGNKVPKEGANPNPGVTGDEETREFARNLFNPGA